MSSTKEARSARGRAARDKGKRVEREAVRKWVAQAIRDAAAGGKGEIPVVCHRKSGDDWLVTLRLDDFLELMKGALNGND